MGIIIRNGHEYSGDSSVSLTQAQYDALEQQGLVNPDVTYFITNTSASTTDAVYANQVAYDNTTSGLNTTTAQGAIDLLATEATVKQNYITESSTALPILLGNSNNKSTETAEVKKPNGLTYSPSSNQIRLGATANTPATIIVQRAPTAGQFAVEESVQLIHQTTNDNVTDSHILRVVNNDTYRGLEAANTSGSTGSGKTILTVDNTNNLKSDCVVREYVDSRNIQDLANVSISTSDNNKLLGVTVSDSSISVGAVSDLFKRVQFANSASITVPANGAVNITANDMHISTPTGYVPVAIASVYCTSNNVILRSFNCYATGTASFGVARNVSGSSESVIFNVAILYIKSEFVSIVNPS